MLRKNTKPVRKSGGARSMLGKIMSRFKTKPKVTVHKKTTKPTVTIQKKLPTKTKNGHDRKEVSHTTIFQEPPDPPAIFMKPSVRPQMAAPRASRRGDRS